MAQLDRSRDEQKIKTRCRARYWRLIFLGNHGEIADDAPRYVFHEVQFWGRLRGHTKYGRKYGHSKDMSSVSRGGGGSSITSVSDISGNVAQLEYQNRKGGIDKKYFKPTEKQRKRQRAHSDVESQISSNTDEYGYRKLPQPNQEKTYQGSVFYCIYYFHPSFFFHFFSFFF